MKKFRVSITDRNGKAPTVLKIEWQATTQKEVVRAVKRFLLFGRYEVEEVKRLGLS